MPSTNTENALGRFVCKARDLFAGEPDLDRRFAALEPLLAELIADRDVIEASRHWPECQTVDNRVENLVFYEDPDYKFVIVGLITRAEGHKFVRRAHDHGRIYTLYGLLDGHQRIERYERLDDGSRPDYAKVRKVNDRTCGPGEIDFVRPLEIHAEDTLGERTVAVIVRSERSGDAPQGRYLFENDRYSVSYGPRLTPYEFYS